jgi:hypothetical protein
VPVNAVPRCTLIRWLGIEAFDGDGNATP